jgi:hypothetical protein
MSSIANTRSKILSINESIHKLRAGIATALYPFAVELSISSLTRVRDDLQAELERAWDAEQGTVVSYRCYSKTDHPPAAWLCQGIVDIQKVFTACFEQLIHGRHSRIPVLPRSWATTALRVGWSFQGSEGMVLSLPRAELFTDRINDAFEEIRNLSDAIEGGAMRELASKHSIGVINAYREWAKNSATIGAGAEVQVRTDGQWRSLLNRSAEQFGRQVRMLGEEITLSSEKLSVTGRLTAISLARSTFTLDAGNGKILDGLLDESLLSEIHSVNMLYSADLQKDTVQRFNKSTPKEVWTLLALKQLPKEGGGAPDAEW